MRPSVGSTLVRLNDWVTMIESGQAEDGLDIISARAGLHPRSEIVETIADSLIDEADHVERNLLSGAPAARSMAVLRTSCASIPCWCGRGRIPAR